MNIFTEQDLQDYFEGSFKGNEQALKEYFTSDKHRKTIFDSYRLLFETLKEQPAAFSVPGMEQKLLASIKERKDKKMQAKELWMIRGVGALSVAATAYCLSLSGAINFEIISNRALYFLLPAIAFCFLLFSYSMEMKRLKRKYSL